MTSGWGCPVARGLLYFFSSLFSLFIFGNTIVVVVDALCVTGGSLVVWLSPKDMPSRSQRHEEVPKPVQRTERVYDAASEGPRRRDRNSRAPILLSWFKSFDNCPRRSQLIQFYKPAPRHRFPLTLGRPLQRTYCEAFFAFLAPMECTFEPARKVLQVSVSLKV